MHSGIQVKPNTRPSLRDGRTAYAVLSREPTFFWPPSLRELMMQSARLGSLASSRSLDRSNDGQDETVLPYARSPDATGSCRSVHTRCKNVGETNLTTPFVRTRVPGSQGLPALPVPSRADAAASTATRPAIRTTREPPLFVGPGWFDLCGNSEFR